ncbi:MAG: holo-ACP synthase [Gemmatimonadales bacterium]|nr:holo-ACP synthase [Gemmatimonadales bacterium]
MGVGIDLIDLSRAEQLLERKGSRALRRLLTESERRSIQHRRPLVQHFASRLAAKEAVYKALQGLPDTRGIGWRDIEVERGPTGRPSVRLHGTAARVMAAYPDLSIHLALSHSATTAGAVAVLEVGTPGSRPISGSTS